MDNIEELISHATQQNQKDLLQRLIAYKQVEKILSSFIPAFEDACLAPDGWHYLYGSFNPGGTLSGRLSSSDPNLQNLPATGSKYAKLIKEMFRAPPGKLFVGLDFNSLEDMISALTTKDPNKLKVYTDCFDGHCLRAAYYFQDQLQHIDLDDPKSVNSIKKTHGHLRQDSKAPTFALTYQGTWRTLVNNCGFSTENAQMIEKRYHEMYVVSDQWVQDRLKVAAQVGYVTVAFGLRLRTPMMKQAIMGLRNTPYEAVAEGRTAGNAMGQSYCLLNSRAGMEFMQRVRSHLFNRLRIRPCAQIHDAQYYLVDDDLSLVHWMNIHLVQCVQWQQLPEIQHPTVKLGGELSIFHPNWSVELTIPNGADIDTIKQRALEHIKQP
jgi:DNA polymerase-1